MSHTKLAEKHAYPVPNDANVNDQEGMTIRQYFAGLALQGMLANHDLGASFQGYAKDAVRFSDALIEELEKEQQWVPHKNCRSNNECYREKMCLDGWNCGA